MKEKLLDLSNLDQEKLQTLDEYMDSLEGENRKEELIPVLYKAQELFGYLPHNLQRHIAIKMGLSSAHVNGVVTFYSYFNEAPMGTYTISVCMGTACYVKGAKDVLDRAKELTGASEDAMSEDGLFSIKDVRCIGACGLAPVMTINDEVYGNLKPDDVDEIIARYKEGSQ
ncbi:MAG: NAD(P)H-dependent oxidoreductase subunit E [Candidatus Izemoplasmataceae bacterium]